MGKQTPHQKIRTLQKGLQPPRALFMFIFFVVLLFVVIPAGNLLSSLSLPQATPTGVEPPQMMYRRLSPSSSTVPAFARTASRPLTSS
jgi:hypothetical protein